MPPITDVLATLHAAIESLRDTASGSDMIIMAEECERVANDLALLHDSLEDGHKRHVDALVAEDRLEEMRTDALANGTFYNQDEP